MEEDTGDVGIWLCFYIQLPGHPLRLIVYLVLSVCQSTAPYTSLLSNLTLSVGLWGIYSFCKQWTQVLPVSGYRWGVVNTNAHMAMALSHPCVRATLPVSLHGCLMWAWGQGSFCSSTLTDVVSPASPGNALSKHWCHAELFRFAAAPGSLSTKSELRSVAAWDAVK